jgi:hypothetical protein
MTFILNFLNGLLKRPLVLLFIVAAILLMLLVNTCNNNRKLKRDIEQAKTELKQEAQRNQNNLKALHDTITYLRHDSVYTKLILSAKQGEIANLDKELAEATGKIKTIIKQKEITKLVYITTINSNISTSDVETKVDRTGDSISIGIATANQLFKIRTQTWFSILPDTVQKKLTLQLIDRYGSGKPSHLDFEQNFKLTIAQVELPDGSKRIYIAPTDLSGNAIDPKLLGISDIKGVDYIDVRSTPPIPIQKKKPRFVLSVGPQAGMTIQNNQLRPYVGFGLGLGLNLLR